MDIEQKTSLVDKNEMTFSNSEDEMSIGVYNDSTVIFDDKKTNELLIMAKQGCGRAISWKEALEHLVSIDINTEEPELYIIDLIKTDLNKFN